VSSDDDDLVEVEVYKRLNNVCMERANQLLERAGESIRAHEIYGQQEHKRKSALARLRACREFIEWLRGSVNFEIDLAVAAGASYAEVGAAAGITRQAIQKRHQRLKVERQQRIEKTRDEDRWEFDYEEDPWPPMPWRFRAPSGLHTVELVDGPSNGQSFRVHVGADAFPFIDHRLVFGQRFACYARYSPRPDDDSTYHFTNEYYLR